jgi:hypothetical protein
MASLETLPSSPAPLTNGNRTHANGGGAVFDAVPVRAHLGALLPALLGAAPDEL